MCTAVTYQGKHHYFGRNLDFEYSYGESVVITPRNYPFHFRKQELMHSHYAIIGMATIDNNYPLYFDGTNEAGLSMAGLYFPGNAVYLPVREDKDNIAPFEFIPWVLGQCKDVTEAENLLKKLNMADISYSDKYPLSPLHWLIADKTRAITVEPMANGLNIYDNPIGVLTNNPPFEFHLYNLAYYQNITCQEVVNRFAPTLDIAAYSRGMGGIGLPGDLSSPSRFIRAAFTKLSSVSGRYASSDISQFFHILYSVAQQRGCVRVGQGYEETIYTSCCDTDDGVYYYTTYDNAQITSVSLHHTNLDANQLVSYPLITGQQIRTQN